MPRLVLSLCLLLPLAAHALEWIVADTRVTGASEASGVAVTRALAEHAASLGASVRTTEDLRKLAAFEQLRQALGCDGDACDGAKALAEAVKADRLLVPLLALVGETRVLSLVLFDTKTGQVLRRASSESADDAGLLERARDGAQRLVAGTDRPASRPRVAGLYFENNSRKEEYEPLRKGLADMLVSDLSRAESVQLVERERIEEVLAELKLQRTKAFDAASAAKVGKLLGAQYLVLGGYFELLGSLRIDARVVKVETGVVEKSVGVNGKKDDFFELAPRLATQLAAGLGTTLREATKSGGGAFADALEYAHALELLDRGERGRAREKLAALRAKNPGLAQAEKLARRAGL